MREMKSRYMGLPTFDRRIAEIGLSVIRASEHSSVLQGFGLISVRHEEIAFCLSDRKSYGKSLHRNH